MKKLILFLFVFMLLFLYLYHKGDEDIIIGDNAIRFRIIANSNDIKDQELKTIIKTDIINYMKQEQYDRLDRASLIKRLKNNLDIESIIKKYTNDYEINYGFNFFPDKKYNGIIYKSGNYESLLIKLGTAKGDNWWCVLYPPLCFIDEDNNEYKSIVKEMINKL